MLADYHHLWDFKTAQKRRINQPALFVFRLKFVLLSNSHFFIRLSSKLVTINPNILMPIGHIRLTFSALKPTRKTFFLGHFSPILLPTSINRIATLLTPTVPYPGRSGRAHYTQRANGTAKKERSRPLPPTPWKITTRYWRHFILIKVNFHPIYCSILFARLAIVGYLVPGRQSDCNSFQASFSVYITAYSSSCNPICFSFI